MLRDVAIRILSQARAICDRGHGSQRSASWKPEACGYSVGALFGRRVDVVAFAATHRPLLLRKDGVLFVNPGSPNLPAAGPGTVAISDLGHPEPRAEIRQIEGNHPPAAILDSRFDDARA